MKCGRSEIHLNEPRDQDILFIAGPQPPLKLEQVVAMSTPTPPPPHWKMLPFSRSLKYILQFECMFDNIDTILAEYCHFALVQNG